MGTQHPKPSPQTQASSSPARFLNPLLDAAADHPPRWSSPPTGGEDAIHLQNGYEVYDTDISLRHRDLAG
jgi:hypothetical protein